MAQCVRRIKESVRQGPGKLKQGPRRSTVRVSFVIFFLALSLGPCWLLFSACVLVRTHSLVGGTCGPRVEGCSFSVREGQQCDNKTQCYILGKVKETTSTFSSGSLNTHGLHLT